MKPCEGATLSTEALRWLVTQKIGVDDLNGLSPGPPALSSLRAIISGHLVGGAERLIANGGCGHDLASMQLGIEGVQHLGKRD